MANESLHALISEVEYELGQRKNVYQRIKYKEPRRGAELDLHTERMEAIRRLLIMMRDEPAKAMKWLGERQSKKEQAV